jgi:hypothetical protein
MTYDVRAGDMLYSVSGNVWGTVDGQLEDVIVSEDAPYTVDRDSTMRFIALGGPATLNITTREAWAGARERPATRWWWRLARHLAGLLLRPALRQPV